MVLFTRCFLAGIFFCILSHLKVEKILGSDLASFLFWRSLIIIIHGSLKNLTNMRPEWSPDGRGAKNDWDVACYLKKDIPAQSSFLIG